MKTTGQNVPPELAALYGSLVATNATAHGGVFTLRTQKAVNLIKKTARVNRLLKACYKAVDQLIAYKQNAGGWTMPRGFRTSQTKAIYNRIFDPEYWVECAIESTQPISGTLGYEPFTGPRNYAYPDPTNQPTKTVCTGGTNTTGTPRYSGSTSAGYFYDDLLVWNRYVFDLANSFEKGDDEPLLITLSATITASASDRPSKAMLSWIVKIWTVPEGDPKTTTTLPPTEKPITNYFRYITPRGDPPFFSSAIDRRAMLDGRRPSSETPAANLKKMVMLFAPMPMMGKRYNNNTQIDTNLSAIEIKAYQIKKITYAKLSAVQFAGPFTLSNGDLTATPTNPSDDAWIQADKSVSAGKWYWEIRLDFQTPLANGYIWVGVRNADTYTLRSGERYYWSTERNKGLYRSSDFEIEETYASRAETGTVIGVALDLVNGTIAMYKNGVYQGIMFAYMFDPITWEEVPIAGELTPYIQLFGTGGANMPIITANFGQSAFAYEAPAGFNAGIW